MNSDPGPNQSDPDNGRSNWGGDFGRYGRGQPLGHSQAGEGMFDGAIPNDVGDVKSGGANPPQLGPEDEAAGD